LTAHALSQSSVHGHFPSRHRPRIPAAAPLPRPVERHARRSGHQIRRPPPMASPGPSSPPPIRSTRRRAPSTAAASNAGVLPADLLFDVLLRLPAKELCRLRAVCRAWRALTADPLFAGAHASLHRGPSLLAKFRGDEAWIHVVDLRGVVLKRMPCPGGGGGGHELLCTRLDLLCVASKDNSCHVLNPATGAAYALPESPAPEHAGRENSRDPYT
ncbi:unnamed protein product, partial [Urochloa humidicola]